MAAPKLTATIFFSDSSCVSGATQIQYSYPNNTDCTAASVSSTCVKSSVINGLYSTTACVDDFATFGNTYIKNTWPQIQSLNTGAGCTGSPTEGWQVPLSVCIPASNVTTFIASKVNIEPTNGTLYLSTYSDSSCYTLKGVKQYGSVGAPSCQASSNKVSVFNYNGLYGITSYTGSDCNTPVKINYVAATSPCTEDLKCLRNGVGEYVSHVCSKTDDLESTARTSFNGTQYFQYQPYVDSNCLLPQPAVAIKLNTCFATTPYQDNSVQSANSSLSTDGSLVTINYYAGANCEGKVVESDPFPSSGACTPNGKVFYSKTPVSTGTGQQPSDNPTDSGSSTNVGAIVGGVVGGLIALGLIAFAAYYFSPKKNVKAGTTIPSSRDNLSTFRSMFSTPSSRPSEQTLPTEALSQFSSRPLSSASMVPSSQDPSTQQSVYNLQASLGAADAATVVGNASVAASYSGSTARSEDFLVSNSDKHAEATMFSSINAMRAPPSKMQNVFGAEEGKDQVVDEALFGDLLLPALPSQWSIKHVIQWVSKNEGTVEVLDYIQKEEIDGRALLQMKVDDFSFPTRGRQLRFQEALDALKNINSAKLLALQDMNPPPEYE